MGKKLNPRKRPASEADVKKAWESGADFGLMFCLRAFLYILKNNHHIRQDEILKLRDEFTELVDAFNRRDITSEDIDEVLKMDFDLHLRMV